MRRRWSTAFFGLGLVCLAMASRAALERTGGAAAPPPEVLATAAVILAAGLLAASLGWVALLAGAAPVGELVHGFMVSQLGKYIPGGLWLGVGQVGLAVGAGVSAPRATGATAVLGVVFVAAGATLAGVTALLLAAGAAPVGAPGLALAGLFAPALLHRRWMSALADRLVRRLARGAPDAVIPSQRRILAAAGSGMLSLACSALAFAVLLQALDPSAGVRPTAAAFAAAWLAGYLAVGLPSGIGAREAVLVALLPVGAGPVLAASLAQRLTQMAVEAGLAAGTRLLVRRRPDRSPTLPLEVPRA